MFVYIYVNPDVEAKSYENHSQTSLLLICRVIVMAPLEKQYGFCSRMTHIILRCIKRTPCWAAILREKIVGFRH
jgi:hypothetical protein